MVSTGDGISAINRLPFEDIWLLWRTGEMNDAEIAHFALARPDFRSWFNQRRTFSSQAEIDVRVHRGSNVESLPTSRTSSGCRDK